MLSSRIITAAMGREKIHRGEYLRDTRHSRFDVGYYDVNQSSIYSDLAHFKFFDKSFTIDGSSCYTVLEDPGNHLGVHYIVLKESNLSGVMLELRMKIIGYLILSFLFMGIVGYFLARLFLSPVRQKIESLDHFISDTTHELNTPVSAILMTIQSLKGCDPRKLKRLEASAKRLSTVYGSLTYRLQEEAMGQGSTQIEPLSVTSLVRERIDYITELAESKHLKIEVELYDLNAAIDRESVIRLLDNLLSNAIKYSDPGGRIMVSVIGKKLIIADEGIGIEKAVQKDIFNRYKRANKERGGFGIGLDIVLSICKHYGIRIDLQSGKGKGSRFILTFP